MPLSELTRQYMVDWTVVEVPSSVLMKHHIGKRRDTRLPIPIRNWLDRHSGDRSISIDETTQWFWFRESSSPTDNNYNQFYFRDPKIATMFKLVWG